MTSLYVGNLPFSATEEDVRAVFVEFGEVSSVKLISDRETGRPRGFGFVEIADDAADAAIAAVNGSPMDGRPLRVSKAQDTPRRSPFGKR